MNTITLNEHDITLFTEQCRKNMVCTEEYADHKEFEAYVSFTMQNGNTFEALVRFTQPVSSLYEPDVNATNVEALDSIKVDEFAELGVFTEGGYIGVESKHLIDAFNGMQIMNCAKCNNTNTSDHSKIVKDHNAMGWLLKQVA